MKRRIAHIPASGLNHLATGYHYADLGLKSVTKNDSNGFLGQRNALSGVRQNVFEYNGSLDERGEKYK